MKILSSILILVTAFLSLKHGWDGLHVESHPQAANMAAELGLGKTGITLASVVSILIGLAILFPQTFFYANLINAGMILLIMAFSLKTGNVKTTFIEIPFLIIPLVLIYLGHPLKK